MSTIKAIFIGLIILALPFQSFSQNYTISGTIETKEANPVDYATILLLHAKDSSVVTGTTTNEKGVFLFKKVAKETYLLKTSFIGYITKYTVIKIEQDTDVGSIILEEEVAELNEVSVIAKKPTIERKANRLVFNVQNTTLSSGNSWEILKKTPGVVIRQDNLMVRGENTIIYLNNRKVQISSSELKTLLESFSGENIGTVEVIFNPPAEYDAEGGPILNINTLKNVSLGYKGSANGAYTQAVFPKYSLGTSHFYKNKKLNLFLNYAHSPRKEFKEDENNVNFIDPINAVFSRWDAFFDRTTRSNAHNINAILDYDLDKRNSLGISTNMLFSPNKAFDNNQITRAFDAANQLDSTFVNKSDLNTDLTNIGLDLIYKHRFKKEGKHLSTNFHYTKYERDRTQNLSTDYFNPANTFLRNVSFFTDAAQNISIYTGQLDYQTPVGDSAFETGLKFSGIDSESGIDFFDVGGVGQIFNPNNSDNFLYDEKVYAAYTSLSKDWEKWSLKVGLRAEQTESTGNSIRLNQINKLSYFELFPTFYLLRKINEDHAVTFDYSRRLSRPRYEDLNPFAYFLNENNFQIGNPGLQPSFANRFNLNYTLKQEYYFDVYYRDNGRFISTLGFQDNENLSVRSLSQNVLESISYGLDFTHSRSITSKWVFWTYMSLFHESETFLAIESNNQQVTNEIDGFFGQFYNSFTLSKNGTFTGELTLTHMTGFIFGSHTQEATTDLTIGLRKTLWKNKVVLTLAAEDLLGEANAWMNSRYLNQDNGFLAVPETQFVRLGFTYKFGNYRLGDNERSIDKKERERLEVN